MEDAAVAVIECFRAFGSVVLSVETKRKILASVQVVLIDSSTCLRFVVVLDADVHE